MLSHGRLPENRNHGGERGACRTRASCADGPVAPPLAITNFVYGQGDLCAAAPRSRPAAVRRAGA